MPRRQSLWRGRKCLSRREFGEYTSPSSPREGWRASVLSEAASMLEVD